MMTGHPRTAAIAFISATLLVLAGCGEADQPADDAPVIRPVKVLTVQSTALALERSYPAVVQAVQEVELSFEVSGRIVELPIRAAMEVDEGDVIARLDTADFEASVASLESQVAQAEAQLRALTAGAREEDIASLEASVDAAQAQVDQARDQLARTQELFDRGVTTITRLDEDRTALAVAEAQLRTAEEELAKGLAGARAEDVEAQEAAIGALEAQLATARKNLEDATLRAPFGGIIARRDVENFVSVQAKAPIALLQQIDRLELTFDVPGPDVARFADAQGVTSAVELDALPGQLFDAEFVEFSTQADQTTQTFRGRVVIDRPEGRGVLPGMIGAVIVSEPQSNGSAILVPVAAVAAETDGSAYVWVVAADTNAVSRVRVETAEATGDSIVVTSGLEDGDMVVVAGLASLQPDMIVRPITEIGG